MTTVYLNIGSNSGDRCCAIAKALAMIAEAFAEAQLRQAPWVESEPWGFESEHRFLNAGIALDFAGAVEPFEMLHTLQGIERAISPSAHRNPDGTYRDREIDIDIIAIDDVRIATAELEVPHPRARLRPFVMGPLLELVGQSGGVGESSTLAAVEGRGRG